MSEQGGFVMPDDGWVQVSPMGEYPHKGAGVTQVIDGEACEKMVADFAVRREAAGAAFAGLLVDFDHFSLDTDKPSEAAGWIVELEARGDGLWAKVRWSDSGLSAVKGGRYRLLSPVFRHPGGTEDLGEGRVRPVMLDSVALTNEPNIKGGMPIANRKPAEEPSPEVPLKNRVRVARIAFLFGAREKALVNRLAVQRKAAVLAGRERVLLNRFTRVPSHVTDDRWTEGGQPASADDYDNRWSDEARASARRVRKENGNYEGWGDEARAASLAVRRAKAAARGSVRAPVSRELPRPGYDRSEPGTSGTYEDEIRERTRKEPAPKSPWARWQSGLASALPSPKDYKKASLSEDKSEPYRPPEDEIYAPEDPSLRDVVGAQPASGNKYLDAGTAALATVPFLAGSFVGGGTTGSGKRGLTAIQKSILRKAAREVAVDKALLRRGQSPKYGEPVQTSSGGAGAGESSPFYPPGTKGWRKALAIVSAPLNASRSLITAFDQSAAGKQGGILSLTHPKSGMKALAAMFRAYSTSKAATDYEAILKRPNARLYKHSGLYIAEGPGGSLTAREESFCSNLAEMLPYGVGKGIKWSERTFSAYLNRLRVDVFDTLAETLLRSDTPPTTRELKAIANYINVATGRGDLGAASKYAQELATVFFAPRLTLSRFQFLAGQPLYGGSNRTREIIGQEYAKYLIGLAVVYQLGQMCGGDVDFDATSSDFGKLRFGKTRVDVLSGLGVSAVFVERELTGKYKTTGGKTFKLRGEEATGKNSWDVALSFLRTKLSPAYGAAANLWTGEDPLGQEVTKGQVAAGMVVPLSLKETGTFLVQLDLPEATVFSLLSLFGVSASYYQNKFNKESQKKHMIEAARAKKAYNDKHFAGATAGEQRELLREAKEYAVSGGVDDVEFLRSLGAKRKNKPRTGPSKPRAKRRKKTDETNGS